MNSDHPFWTFSLAVYAQPGVAAECLALQDRDAIDVNILLFCAWLGASRCVLLRPTDLDRITKSIETWTRDVVVPLRQARRAAKVQGQITLAKQIADTELAAEREAQDRLFALSSSLPQASHETAATCVRRNIELLLETRRDGKSPFPGALEAAARTHA